MPTTTTPTTALILDSTQKGDRMDGEQERRAQSWLAYSSAAVAGLTNVIAPPKLDDDGEVDEDELEGYSDEIAVYAASIADKMLAEFNERFEAKPARRSRKRRDNDEEGD